MQQPDKEPRVLEEEAYSFLYQEKFDEAFSLFKRAGDLYRNKGNYKQAAICLAAAASSWSIKSGEKTFYNSASSYDEAAREAEEAGDLEYASVLYKYAAVNYERDMELINFSECFYRSKESYRKFLSYLLIKPTKIHPIAKSEEEKGFRGFLKHIFICIALTFSYIIWGHGEKPSRTFYCGTGIIILSAYLYTHGSLLRNAMVFKPNFFQGLYFSVITFFTVGYGDITPIGFCKIIAMAEAFSGVLVMSLFVVGLSRKYLRV